MKVPVIVNSYMLPQGTRFGSAAAPRATRATKWTATAMTVSSTPSRPNIATRPSSSRAGRRSRRAAGVGAATPPAATDSFAADATGTFRSELHSTRCASSARK